MATRLARAGLAGLLFTALGWLLFVNLGALPGLHGDEAYFFLRAVRMSHGEEINADGMNGYSGGLYPYLVSRLFLYDVSVRTLRLPSAICTLVTAALAAGLVSRATKGRTPAYLTLAVVLSAPLMTLDGRVAWEVTSLGPLLALLLIVAAVLVVEDSLRIGALLLFSASLLGAFNHFIFAHLCGGLMVTAALLVVLRRSDAHVKLLVLSLINLINVGAFSSFKLIAHAQKLSFTPAAVAACVLVLVETILLGRSAAFWAALDRRVGNGDKLLRSGLRIYFAAGGALFAIGLAVACVDVFAGDVLFQRLYSQALPLPSRIAAYLYAITMLGTYARAAHTVLTKPSAYSRAEGLLLLLPLGVMASLPFLVGPVASIRYFILLNLTLILAVSVVLGGSRLRLLPLVQAALLTIYLAPILNDAHHYDTVSSRTFRVGFQSETSSHFFSTERVIEHLRADRIDLINTTDDFFIGGPLACHRLMTPWDATPGTWATVDYTHAVAGGFRYERSGMRSASR